MTDSNARRLPIRPLIAVLALLAVCAVSGLVAVPAADAATYIITLDNGRVFESRYQPEEASWDEDMVLLLTEHGNWIGLDRSSIADVTTDIEASGFGTVIDNKTISLGVLANDLPVPDEEGPTNQELMQQYLTSQPPAPDYTVQQFVDPSEAGGGLPVGYSQAPQAPLILTDGN